MMDKSKKIESVYYIITQKSYILSLLQNIWEKKETHSQCFMGVGGRWSVLLSRFSDWWISLIRNVVFHRAFHFRMQLFKKWFEIIRTDSFNKGRVSRGGNDILSLMKGILTLWLILLTAQMSSKIWPHVDAETRQFIFFENIKTF